MACPVATAVAPPGTVALIRARMGLTTTWSSTLGEHRVWAACAAHRGLALMASPVLRLSSAAIQCHRCTVCPDIGTVRRAAVVVVVVKAVDRLAVQSLVVSDAGGAWTTATCHTIRWMRYK